MSTRTFNNNSGGGGGNFVKKIYSQQTLLVPNAPFTLTIPHGLGYKPSKMVIKMSYESGSSQFDAIRSEGYSDFSGNNTCWRQEYSSAGAGSWPQYSSSTSCFYWYLGGSGSSAVSGVATADATNIYLTQPNGTLSNPYSVWFIIDLYS